MIIASVLFLAAVMGVIYVFISTRDEEKRQEWRRASRATWVKN